MPQQASECVKETVMKLLHIKTVKYKNNYEEKVNLPVNVSGEEVLLSCSV